MSRRVGIAAGVIALWLGGLAMLAKREMFGGEAARLAHAALFVAPGAQYYAVWQGDRQVGFASSTIDTTARSFVISDQFIARIPADDSTQRVVARSTAVLTRTLQLRSFAYEVRRGGAAHQLLGTILGDSLVSLRTISGESKGQVRLVRLDGPLLVPGMVPMVIALGQEPKVGASRTASIFDPLTDSLASVTVNVVSESLFVVVDSATRDTRSQRWVAAHSDTVRAWRIEQQGGGMLTGWIDGRGRMIEAEPLGPMAMRQTAYEIAFHNWMDDSTEANTR